MSFKALQRQNVEFWPYLFQAQCFLGLNGLKPVYGDGTKARLLYVQAQNNTRSVQNLNTQRPRI